MEKTSLAKEVGKRHKGSSKIDIVSSFTSQLAVLKRATKGTSEFNYAPRTNKNGCQGGKTGVSTVRFVRRFQNTQKKDGGLRYLQPEGRHVGNGLSLRRFVLNTKGAPVAMSETGPSSDLSWSHGFRFEEATTARTTSSTSKTTSVIQTMAYRNVLDVSLQHEGEQSLHTASTKNENVGVKGKQTTSYNIPSECSSLNSSIAQSPPSKNGIHVDKETWEATQQEENGVIPCTNIDDVDQLLLYDEEDEKNAVQQYMGNGETTGTLLGTDQKWTSPPGSFLRLTSRMKNEVDSVSTGHNRLASRCVSCPNSRIRKQAKERSQLTFLLPSGISSNRQTSNDSVLSELISDDECRFLSLYNAFFLDEEGKRWLVDDHVLSWCLNYIGLMGYQQLVPSQSSSSQQPQQDTLPIMRMGMMTSPIVSAPIEERSLIHGVVSSCWMLNGRPSSAASHLNKLSSFFISRQEAERWLSEQEYVIGTILSCCAWGGDCGESSDDNYKVPYLKPSVHPIRYAAMFVLERFPRWGGVMEFIETWEQQIGIVLGTASPPHQRVFRFPEEGLVFSSDMEGGNLARVERTRNAICQPAFNLWIEPEFKCEQRLWFRFAIIGIQQNSAVCLKIVNIQPNTKLYVRNGMRPVWCTGDSPRQWMPVGQCSYRTINNDTDGELTFMIIPRSNDVVHVAFCVPYTYADLLCHVANWHYLVKRSTYGIRFEERILCRTQDGRKLHLLIITGPSPRPDSARRSYRGIDFSNNEHSSIVSPYSYFDKGKKVVLLSGRVHPGEVTASHGIHGVIAFLLSRDPHAMLLREHFIFYIVPMLNPDGVARGHSRLDQNGFNLNRCYKNPSPQTQPTVNALRNVFEDLQRMYMKRFFMYLDFHSHASQSSGFMFGNCLPAAVQHWNLVFPKIVSLHAKDVFSYELCRFGKGHMTSKEGSSRVLFGGSLIHSYTVELTHFTNNKMFVDGSCSDDGGNSGNMDSVGRFMFMGICNDSDCWEARYANIRGCRQGGSGTSWSEGVVSPLTPRPRSARIRKLQLLSQNNIKRRMHNNNNSNSSGIAAKTNGNVHMHSGKDGRNSLRRIDTLCILSQSAEVGRACLMALLDYCAVRNYTSPQFSVHGGMERALREVKRNKSISIPVKLNGNRIQFIYKQH